MSRLYLSGLCKKGEIFFSVFEISLADCLRCTHHILLYYSIIKLIPFSSSFAERFSGLAGDFVCN